MCPSQERIAQDAGPAARLKQAGDAEYKRGNLEAACTSYSQALALCPGHTTLLCNLSLVKLKLGNHEAALEDACTAIELLHRSHPPDARAQSKAWYRKGCCLAAMGDSVAAVAAFQNSLTGVKPDASVLKALRDAALQLPVPWMAEHWTGLIADAESPNPLSSRDGKLLKPVALEQRLTRTEMADRLATMLELKLAAESRELLAACWLKGIGSTPSKAQLAVIRGYAYLQAGRFPQALKDGKVALAYGPQADDQCCWARAHAVVSAAHEGLQDNVPAALAMQTALELDAGNAEFAADLERLMRRIPEGPAEALQAGGSAGLLGWLAEEEERNKPEFLKRRPKYYYYYEWMRERISEACPALPSPVMDKLLTMDAGELDLILTHKQAAREKAALLLEVLETDGPKYLETYRIPPLTWQEVKELTGPGTIGLGLNGAVTSVAMLDDGAQQPKRAELPATAARNLPALPYDAGDAALVGASTMQRPSAAPNSAAQPQSGVSVLVGGQTSAADVEVEDEVDLDGVD